MTEEHDAKAVPLVYINAEDVTTLFANNFVIQHAENEFVLTISQIQKPIVLGTPEERRQQIDRISYIPAKIVARVGFTRERMVALINALEDNLRRHDETFGRKESNDN